MVMGVGTPPALPPAGLPDCFDIYMCVSISTCSLLGDKLVVLHATRSRGQNQNILGALHIFWREMPQALS